MKKSIAFLALLLCIGCSYEGKTFGDYFDDPGSIIKDPHYGSYQDKRDMLESQYLNKKITYAEYVERLKAIDDNYDREVNERTQIIDSAY